MWNCFFFSCFLALSRFKWCQNLTLFLLPLFFLTYHHYARVLFYKSWIKYTSALPVRYYANLCLGTNTRCLNLFFRIAFAAFFTSPPVRVPAARFCNVFLLPAIVSCPLVRQTLLSFGKHFHFRQWFRDDGHGCVRRGMHAACEMATCWSQQPYRHTVGFLAYENTSPKSVEMSSLACGSKHPPRGAKKSRSPEHVHKRSTTKQ